jgi:hypothetical protein
MPTIGNGHDCERCGETLYGGRAKFCGAACRSAAWRDSQRDTPRPRVTCALCGMKFLARYGNQRICDYNSGQADGDCKALQDDLMEQLEEAAEVREEATCEREGCEVSTYRPGRGRPKRFCSPRCKTAHYRAEKRNA